MFLSVPSVFIDLHRQQLQLSELEVLSQRSEKIQKFYEGVNK